VVHQQHIFVLPQHPNRGTFPGGDVRRKPGDFNRRPEEYVFRSTLVPGEEIIAVAVEKLRFLPPQSLKFFPIGSLGNAVKSNGEW
jgi:hypothetical protein